MSQAGVTVSELFQEYRADFDRLCQEINELLELANTGEKTLQHLTDAERRINKAEQNVKQMEMEARSMPPDSRAGMQSMVRQCRSDLTGHRKAVASAKEVAERTALLSETDGTMVGKSMKDRQRLDDTHQSLKNASKELAEAKERVLESEQIGIDVMSDLRQQRETIIRSRDNVARVGQNYGFAGEMLERMQRRAAANQRISYIVCCVMAVMLVIAGYVMMHG
eukprot:TRINITY_DN36729_c0_g1_i1.p1 TRINITY_DN36729_c0_g1~~TRINITY_DN36729_c0_g1_i1.p1  ORF type:complete len:223 (+),score=42.10 TRINITY_DN36729_c0_g1_i1:69-737(+)